MGYSKVEICNLALLNIGQATIQALTESSQEAVYCNAFYDSTRKQILRGHTWNFATKVVELAQLTNSPVDFTYAYALPSDCLRVIGPVYASNSATESSGASVYYPDNSPNVDPRALVKKVKYEIRADSDGTKILVTDEEEFYLQYVYDVDDPNKYDSTFVEAFAYLLASKLAGPITGDTRIANYMNQVYNSVLPEAESHDASENRESDYAGMDLIDSRY